VRSLGARLPVAGCETGSLACKPAQFCSLARIEVFHSMSHYSYVDRESFQNILASAFTMQQRLTDGEWLSAPVEVERFTRNVSSTTGDAVGPLHEQVPTLSFEVGERGSGTSATPEESAPKLGVCLDASSGLFSGIMQTGEAPRCDATEVSTFALGRAADILDACFPSFRVCQPEVKAARLRPRDWWRPAQLILLVVLALLLGWTLGRISSRRFADTKGTPLVSAMPDAVTAQPEKNRQADLRSQPPGSRRSTSPETAGDSLVVYERGRIIFRLKEGEDVASANAKSGESLTNPAHGSLGPTPVRLVRRVEPEYPKAAKQQHLQGPVVLEVEVGRDGRVQQLSVVSGSSLLAAAASDAVRHWRFTPLVQNGHAVRFQTRIKIDYVLP
jgi:TonB family protein